MDILLETGIKCVKNVSRFNIGEGALSELSPLLESLRKNYSGNSNDAIVIYFLDDNFFRSNEWIKIEIGMHKGDHFEIIESQNEPKTEGIDGLVKKLKNLGYKKPVAVVGIGGGITLDTAKAVSNLLGNEGLAADYQGWDLLKGPGVFKIGIPTISGTGAEATRTCVMTNEITGIKLGMNSDFTVFDYVIMDPRLTKTVPRNQYFYTGMDSYIHCVEALSGEYRNSIGDAYSRETISLCRQVFRSDDMLSAENRERLMVASYLGGCSIATSYVGLVHPLSAALSVVLGFHHCVANCIVMRAMDEFDPEAYQEFWEMVEAQKIKIPTIQDLGLSEDLYKKLYDSCIQHKKPLRNALGKSYLEVLTYNKAKNLFKKM